MTRRSTPAIRPAARSSAPSSDTRRCRPARRSRPPRSAASAGRGRRRARPVVERLRQLAAVKRADARRRQLERARSSPGSRRRRPRSRPRRRAAARTSCWRSNRAVYSSSAASPSARPARGSPRPAPARPPPACAACRPAERSARRSRRPAVEAATTSGAFDRELVARRGGAGHGSPKSHKVAAMPRARSCSAMSPAKIRTTLTRPSSPGSATMVKNSSLTPPKRGSMPWCSTPRRR